MRGRFQDQGGLFSYIRPEDGDGSKFHGQRRKNDTHQSTSDPQAKLYRKAAGREAKLCYMGHAVLYPLSCRRRRRCQPRSLKTLLDYPQLFSRRPSTASVVGSVC